MTASVWIEPDTAFIEEVMSSGGAGLKKCFQCAACSAVCNLSPEDSPFPRRQIIAAQWGLKERVVGDPALWLCHDCGDCTVQCPRGARPSDTLGALRQAAIKHFAVPQALAKAVASPKMLVLLLLVPALIFAGIALWAPKTELDPLKFASVFPIGVLEPLFFIVAGLVALAFATGIARFVRALRASGASAPILAGLAPALKEILAHSRFSKCDRGGNRRLGHLLTLWGFAGLALMGTVVGIGTMAGIVHTPLALTNPLKIFANLCAVAILAGSITLLAERTRDPVERTASTYFDWFFLLTLVGVVVTGIGSELLRLARAAGTMYVVYFVHLVLIFALFLYAPYSKFAHFVYRTVAMAAVGRKS
ncbi:MAG: quinone-interacting membrane-bound oxidoreductase complex subunit QmoC [Bryobacteraceae bacterium]|jgi:quinone-modifying oxidoreductase subunit QmoC